MISTPAIELKDIHVSFKDEHVLSCFSLTVPEGKKYTLTGQSGSGKSTILKLLMGFVIPDEGSVHILGEELNSNTVWKLRRKICYVAQEPELGEGNVEEILQRPFTYKANTKKEPDINRIRQMLNRVNLPIGILKKEISSLSGGEKQRVAMISALLLQRSVYLFDEPTSALDEDNKIALIDYLNSLKGMTILTVAHDLKDYRFADRIITLNHHHPVSANDNR